MNAFENERTPQFVEQMKESARLVAELSANVAAGSITLEEATKRLMSQPSWSGSVVDARLILAH